MTLRDFNGTFLAVSNENLYMGIIRQCPVESGYNLYSLLCYN